MPAAILASPDAGPAAHRSVVRVPEVCKEPGLRLFVPSVPFALVLLTAVLVASCIESALGAAAIMVAGCFFGIVAGAFTSDVLGIPEGLPGVN